MQYLNSKHLIKILKITETIISQLSFTHLNYVTVNRGKNPLKRSFYIMKKYYNLVLTIVNLVFFMWIYFYPVTNLCKHRLLKTLNNLKRPVNRDYEVQYYESRLFI